MANFGDGDGLYSMSSRHRNVLIQCRKFLIENLDVKPIIDEFVTEGLISPHQEESLMVHKTNSELVRNFCNTLLRLGPTAFLSFLNALTATNQVNIRAYIESKDAETDSVPVQQPRQPMAEDQRDSSGVGQMPVKSVDDYVIPNQTKGLKPRLEGYRMRGGKYVNVFIINNENFTDTKKFPCRYGSSQDVKNLEELFSRKLNFNVRTVTELNAADMRLKLTLFSREEAHKEADACIVVIMSHGGNGRIYGTDGEPISVQTVMELFGAENCKNLIDKPKYFIFQSCRGEHKEIGVNLTDAASSEAAAAPIDAHPLARDAQSEVKHIPNMVDTLVSYATLPGFVSWRNSENGSWFIQAFCSILTMHSADHSVITMLPMVTNEMVKKYGSDSYDNVQLCQHVIHLRREFYLTATAM